GDFITLAGQTGTVEAIDFFQTTLKTKDGMRVTLPNSLAMGSVVTNYSQYPIRRIDLTVSISYGDNVASAKQVLMNIAENHSLVLEDPAPQAIMSEMTDHGVELTLRSWVSTSNYGKVRAVLLEEMKEQIEQSGCTIPFPQLVLHRTS
ncbi:hypothetical protein SCG7086_AU_00010, partial [Chlamydiales bacterium SCGC AG-110-P3]